MMFRYVALFDAARPASTSTTMPWPSWKASMSYATSARPLLPNRTGRRIRLAALLLDSTVYPSCLKPGASSCSRMSSARRGRARRHHRLPRRLVRLQGPQRMGTRGPLNWPRNKASSDSAGQETGHALPRKTYTVQAVIWQSICHTTGRQPWRCWLSMPEDWIEVNLIPTATVAPGARILPKQPVLQLIDPLIHTTLGGRWEQWHYFWEYEPINEIHIRLRILWRESASATDREKLTSELNQARDNTGIIGRWFEGDNGVEHRTYTGEESFYTPELWKFVYKDWTSGCELAVAILKLEDQGTLPPDKSLEFQWRRREHLFSSPLGLTHGSEADLCLIQAYGYVMGNGNTPRVREIMAAINRYNPQVP
jgi:hypothetical protein